MDLKLTKLKETFDKLKNYTYRFEIIETGQDATQEFLCKLFVNSLLISQGSGKKKKISKQQCAEQGYNELIKKDWEFAEKNNIAKQKNNYIENLLHMISEMKSKFHIYKLLEETIEDSGGYKQCYLEYDNIKAEGFSFNELEARNTSSYNMIQAIIEKHPYGQYFDIINYSQDPHKKVKIEYNDKIYDNNPNQQIIQQHSQAKANKLQNQLISLKIEHQDIPQQPNYNYTQENCDLSYQLAKQLQLNNESQFIFLSFMEYLRQFNFEIVGSFLSKSIRITKPELDVIVEYPSDLGIMQDFYALQTQAQGKEFRRTQEDNVITFTYNNQPITTILNINQIPPLAIKLYFQTAKIDEKQLIHTREMQEYNKKYEQLHFSSLSLCLVHQWRDDNLEILPKQLLDYLVVQTTNQFNYLNSPYQVLSQIIYLLKIGVLEELNQRTFEDIEINPFLQSISTYYLDLIKEIDNESLIQIRQCAMQWNKLKIYNWLKKYI
ncbi:unnamed protein product [Paramecium sonneborni]|uniref:DRBM domain-containing protein n=1 Tax=Paramecium sonneborni TaxID=65129 RepID=A0A8S1N0P1_9CILI|nr:unnamed protein product [Paramecium sonneborni]